MILHLLLGHCQWALLGRVLAGVEEYRGVPSHVGDH